MHIIVVIFRSRHFDLVVRENPPRRLRSDAASAKGICGSDVETRRPRTRLTVGGEEDRSGRRPMSTRIEGYRTQKVDIGKGRVIICLRETRMLSHLCPESVTPVPTAAYPSPYAGRFRGSQRNGRTTAREPAAPRLTWVVDSPTSKGVAPTPCPQDWNDRTPSDDGRFAITRDSRVAYLSSSVRKHGRR